VIQATELRIENWIYGVYAPFGKEESREYIQVGIEEMKLAVGVLSVMAVYHEPIPLTPEILEKVGFVIDNNGSYWKSLGTHYLEFIITNGWYYPVYAQLAEVSSEAECKVGLNRIQFVHQLQNLYFVLVGEELNISL
jgi:hypothetical protein